MAEENSFGVWLRKQRRALDLTRQVFANQVGCAEVTLRRIENGVLKPSKELALILLEKIGIPEHERPQWVAFARGLTGLPTKQGASFPTKPITNLPSPITTFIGREKEQIEVNKLIHKHRLITLTGSGGVGKTRLSLKIGGQVLGDYANGVWLAELASVIDPDLLPQILTKVFGITAQPKIPLIEILINFLRPKIILLILDNCEHLLDACAELTDSLLKNCPNLKILATSREPMGITGEAVYRVPSFGLPHIEQVIEKIRDFESVRLFEERAQLVQTDFSLTLENASFVARICSRLDGIPLAIELAAAKVYLSSVKQIAEQLDQSFNLLTGGSRTALPRQQTIRTSIEWSWNLLTESEQIFMRQLSVFAGGWTLESAQAVCEGDVLDLTNALVKKSLIMLNQESGGETRYHFHETIRQHAHEKLVESSEIETLCNRHLGYFVKLAEDTESKLHSQSQLVWLNRLSSDHDNIWAALEWSQNGGEASAGLRLATALWWFWTLLSLFQEGYRWLDRTLEHGQRESAAITLRARGLYRAGHQAIFAGEPVGRTRALLQESLELNRELDNKAGYAYSLMLLGWITEETEASYKEIVALARQTNDEWLVSATLLNAGAFMVGREPTKAVIYLEECLSRFRRLGDRWGLGWSNLRFAQVNRLQGKDEQVVGLLEESLKLFRELGYKVGAREVLFEQANRAISEDNYDIASKLFEENLALARDMGNKQGVANGLLDLGSATYHQGEYHRAATLMAESFTSYHAQGVMDKIPACLAGLARVNAALEHIEKAARLLGALETLHEQLGINLNPTERIESDSLVNSLKSKMGEEAFQSAWKVGKQMSLDEAVAYALKELQ